MSRIILSILKKSCSSCLKVLTAHKSLNRIAYDEGSP